MADSTALMKVFTAVIAGSTAIIVFVNLGKIACTLAFNLLYLYVVELYPTIIRSVASSTGNFCARLASILAPFIAQLVRIDQFVLYLQRDHLYKSIILSYV